MVSSLNLYGKRPLGGSFRPGFAASAVNLEEGARRVTGPAPPPRLVNGPVSVASPPSAAETVPVAPAPPPLIDPKENPLGALGLVLSSTAAGIGGRESPVAALQAARDRHRELQFRSAELAQNVVERYAPILAQEDPKNWDNVLGHMQQMFGPAIGNTDIRPLVRSLASKTVEQRKQLIETMRTALSGNPERLKLASAAVAVGADPAKIMEAFATEKPEKPDKTPAQIAADKAAESPAAADAVNLGLKQGTKEYDNYIRERTLPKPAVTNINLGAQGAFIKALGEKEAGLFSDRHDAALKAVDGINSVQEGRQLLDQGMFTGAFADWRLSGAKAFGLSDDAVKNTETFKSAIGRQTLALVKQLGSGTAISNADREYADKVAGGKIDLNQSSLYNILGLNERLYRAVVRKYNTQADQVQKRVPKDAIPYELTVQEPAASAGTTKSGVGFKILGP